MPLKAPLSRSERIARDVRAANEWFFGDGRARYERAIEAERTKPSASYRTNAQGLNWLGGKAVEQPMKGKGRR
jgi:hypothetical protein